MSALHQLTHLSCQILHSGVQWLIYIRLVPGKGVLEFGATDGTQKMFRRNFAWENVTSAFDNNPGDDQIVQKIRESFQKSQVHLTVSGVKLKINLSNRADFELYEVSGNEAKSELSKLLFSFAEKCAQLSTELQIYKTRDSSDESSPSKSESGSAANANSRKRVQNSSKTSALNPGSKIRKKAAGLAYD